MHFLPLFHSHPLASSDISAPGVRLACKRAATSQRACLEERIQISPTVFKEFRQATQVQKASWKLFSKRENVIYDWFKYQARLTADPAKMIGHH
jgi:hypothetical protein